MYTKDWYSFRDIHEIWDAIEEEYRTFPKKYGLRKKEKEE